MARGRSRQRGTWRTWALRLLVLLVVGPLVLVLPLRWIDPPTSAFIIQRQIDLWVAGSAQRVAHEWVDWQALPPALPLAVVAAEDQHFPQHFGFDLDAIAAAVQGGADGGRLRGASTISQQVAKNLFLWSGRSWVRKGLEAYFTVLIELTWPKRRILEVYLNIAQFGDSVFGVGAAGPHFFDRPARQLDAYEAALLAAVLPNPVRFRADAPSPYVYGRAAWIRTQMQQLGSDYLAGL
ncbi:MAG: monofunctional biosynthetic peptidoglycan transglycosylase [Thiohalobacteraceae bacterium]|nr:monofunctional biosynthetic peptidoglycan transglycosylase [Gammaproteobacteria bacterium]